MRDIKELIEQGKKLISDEEELTVREIQELYQLESDVVLQMGNAFLLGYAVGRGAE